MSVAEKDRTCLIIGAGGHARTIADALLASVPELVILMLDPEYPGLRESGGFPVIGTPADLLKYRNRVLAAYAGVGNAFKRLSILDSLQASGFRLPTLVHPASWVSPRATLGPGVVVMAGAVVQTGARLGRGCIVNTASSVDHDCELGNGVHIAPGSHLAGGVRVGARSWIGIGAAVREYVAIGADVTVGAGAAVIDDIEDGCTVVGVPARAT